MRHYALFSIILASCLLGSALYAFSGSGTPADPFLISTPAELNSIGSTPAYWSSHFKLTADIDMSAYTGMSYNIIGNNANHFTGGFDGNGFIISNLTYTGSSSSQIGLFGYTENALIKNVQLIDVEISSTGQSVGGLVGLQLNGTTQNCSVSGTVAGGGYNGGLVGELVEGAVDSCFSEAAVSGGSHVGGLAGHVYTSTVSSCYAAGNVSGAGSLGGLLGYVDTGTILNCYAKGAVAGTGGYIGGLIGYIQYGTVSDCYSTGAVSAGPNGWIGGLAGYSWQFGAPALFTACFWDTQTSGISDGLGNVAPDPAGITGLSTALLKIKSTFTSAGWDFSWTDGTPANWVIWEDGVDYPELTWQPAQFAGGNGTAANPWRISKPEHLLYLTHRPVYFGDNFLVICDIDMSAYTGTMYKPIGSSANPFKGVFDGGGHRINNLSYVTNLAEDNVGMFGYISGATIRNLGLGHVNIYSAGDAVGGLVGYQLTGSISRCYTAGDVEGTNSVGGLVGFSYRTIRDSYSAAYVTANGLAGGGLVGVLSSRPASVSRCFSRGRVIASAQPGGLIGQNFAGRVSNSFWDRQSSQQNASAAGTGLTTAEMKTRSTFIDAEWDFLDETANGTEDIWRMCVDGVHYPKLTWEFAGRGDFACPDGVTIVDFPYLSRRWQLTNCIGSNNYCGWADLDVSSQVDLDDLEVFVENWLTL